MDPGKADISINTIETMPVHTVWLSIIPESVTINAVCIIDNMRNPFTGVRMVN